MKKLILLALTLLAAATLSACQSAGPVADCFDEAEVKAAAAEVVATINDYDFDRLYDMFRADIREDITADYLEEQLLPYLAAAGAFSRIKGSATAGQQLEDGTDFAVCLVRAKYENQSLSFTVSFDQELQLIGLYVK